MVENPRSVLIVGAGPTGLTAALELSRRGKTCRIIDAKDGPTPLSKAVGISAHSLDILGASNVAEKLLARGLKIQHAHFHFEGRELGIIDFAILPHRYNFLLSLPQSDTETAMAEELARFGIKVEWCTRFEGLTEHDDAVDARMAPANKNRESIMFLGRTAPKAAYARRSARTSSDTRTNGNGALPMPKYRNGLTSPARLKLSFTEMAMSASSFRSARIVFVPYPIPRTRWRECQAIIE